MTVSIQRLLINSDSWKIRLKYWKKSDSNLNQMVFYYTWSPSHSSLAFWSRFADIWTPWTEDWGNVYIYCTVGINNVLSTSVNRFCITKVQYFVYQHIVVAQGETTLKVLIRTTLKLPVNHSLWKADNFFCYNYCFIALIPWFPFQLLSFVDHTSEQAWSYNMFDER